MRGTVLVGKSVGGAVTGMYTGECHGITLVALSQGRHKEVTLVAFGL